MNQCKHKHHVMQCMHHCQKLYCTVNTILLRSARSYVIITGYTWYSLGLLLQYRV